MNCGCIIQKAALTRLNVRLHLMVRVSQSQNLELYIDSESIQKNQQFNPVLELWNSCVVPYIT